MKGQATMPYSLRPMSWDDLDQVSVIERQAFPTIWPPTSLKREMRNQYAHYAVTVRRGEQVPATAPSKLHALIHTVRHWMDMGSTSPKSPKSVDLVTGFVGMWYMGDEAHIVAIAVADPYRRQGIGELLLIGCLEMAMRAEQGRVTLEVRVSNNGAINLYEKYGFLRMGVRKGYYSDNREDAHIMSTPEVNSEAYQQLLNERRSQFEERYGEATRTYA